LAARQRHSIAQHNHPNFSNSKKRSASLLGNRAEKRLRTSYTSTILDDNDDHDGENYNRQKQVEGSDHGDEGTEDDNETQDETGGQHQGRNEMSFKDSLLPPSLESSHERSLQETRLPTVFTGSTQSNTTQTYAAQTQSSSKHPMSLHMLMDANTSSELHILRGKVLSIQELTAVVLSEPSYHSPYPSTARNEHPPNRALLGWQCYMPYVRELCEYLKEYIGEDMRVLVMPGADQSVILEIASEMRIILKDGMELVRSVFGPNATSQALPDLRMRHLYKFLMRDDLSQLRLIIRFHIGPKTLPTAQVTEPLNLRFDFYDFKKFVNMGHNMQEKHKQ
jgi:hypothetical protein